MKIGGLQPVTLLDYPHKVAAIIFTSGCNMRCHFCYNPNLVLPELIEQASFLPEEDVLAFLRERKKYLDGVCITGGEPALQPDLISFCQKIKELGYAIKLDTNGLLPQVVENLLSQNLLDYVAMDIKGPLETYEKYCGIAAPQELIQKSIHLLIDGTIDYEFRSTLVNGLHTIDDVAAMAQLIAGATKYYLQNFNPQEVLVDSDLRMSSFSANEMADFRNAASRHVQNCFLR